MFSHRLKKTNFKEAYFFFLAFLAFFLAAIPNPSRVKGFVICC